MSKKVRRLFEQFQPKHYILDLAPNRETMKLSGDVVVTGQKVGRPSQRLTFHQHGLTITNVHIIKNDKKGDREIAITRINHHASADEVRLHTEEMLYPGQYTVRMTFRGEITKPLDGIYPATFEHEGKKKTLILTQFESHHAREAFPCIDEPEAKATFDLTLTSPAGETVLSNTPVKEQKTVGDTDITTFETTPHMSTYLLAFIFGELGYKEAKSKRGVVIRAYATPDNVQYLDYAVEFGAKCLDFYEQYFDIPYPLEKCDLIAIPDFASGAMENWGCITFREYALVLDPKNASLPMKQYVAMVIAHELTHQWFGNLVTMRWWTDLWLNEGFATWMSYLALDHFYPDWQVWTQFIVDEQQIGFRYDALANTHPIQVPINNPDEIRTIFDNISYDKGGSALHMLHHYLGAQAFRDGLRFYLKKHSYANAETVDLWEALQSVAHKPVKDFMAAWIEQPGFPLLRATIEDTSVTLSQETFLLNPVGRDQIVTPRTWPVPLGTDDHLPDLLTTPTAQYATRTSEQLIKLNHNQSGFYRVTYNASHIERLSNLVQRGKLTPLDRLGILSDAFETAKAGYADTTLALKLLEAYKDEDNSAVWDIIAGNLVSIRTVMNDEELREAMKPYIRKLTATQLKRLGWKPHKNESYFDSLLRPTIIGLAASADEPDVLAEIDRLYATMKQPEDIPADLRSIVYVTVARRGGKEVFERLLALHNDSTSSEERLRLCDALTNFTQPTLIKRALDLIMTDAIRTQDAMYWVAYSFMNRYAREITWDWMTSHWDWFAKNLGTDLAFGRMPIYAARVYSDRAFLKKYTSFFEKVTAPMLDRSIKQGIEFIEWQSAWKQRDLDLIKTFFGVK
jgi:aminopeptidase N